MEADLILLHQKEARKKNENLIAFKIPVELSVTLRKLGINPKEVCLKALLEIANRNIPAHLINQTKPKSSPVSKKRKNFGGAARI